ncbi:MAG TPA: tetratricopeptide repeat protein [Pseudonocardiaceae bacterium]|jgi:serine/threonine-protein kinase PknG|nr:tetratricopeptide repeat protein [Pseudonocardiaceae bacterium]
MTTTTACARPGCAGTIEDGFCSVCGMAPAQGAPAPVPAKAVSTPMSAPTGSASRTEGLGTNRTTGGSLSVRGARTTSSGTSRTSSSRSSTSTRRGRLGAGLVEVPSVPYQDPASAVMANPEVAERKRFCSNCGQPVGRGRDGRPGRTEGFCRHCGSAYSFTPKLVKGDVVGGQYEVLGCLAHGGLGWIYLARDRNVSDRWVVLKGLLDTGDSEAMAAAVAEQRFLAEVEHPNIVRIYNFVQHPDPSGGTMVGYIVMEFVGGRSLKELRSQRDAAGQLIPLPVGQAIAYALEVLPALGYLHGLGLLYCDFKPDNVIQSQEQIKLIDLGAVRHMDDDESPVYKTDGYCAPELATDGMSISADLYTVARTLSVLTFNFDYLGVYRDKLPAAADVPLLARHGSYHRFLARATALDRDARFESAAEMVDQLTGVLREVLATEDGEQRSAMSTLFSPERGVFGASSEDGPTPPDPVAVVASLPVPQVDTTDPAAGLLATSAATDPAAIVASLSGAPLQTIEVRLRIARARIEQGDVAGAERDLDALAVSDPGDWRVSWYRGLAALLAGRDAEARHHFDAIYGWLPGEATVKLAIAVAEERKGNLSAAGHFYELVWRTDHNYVSAAFGLARVRLLAGDRAGCIATLDSVPSHSSHYLAAQLTAVRAGVYPVNRAEVTEGDLLTAGERLERVDLDAERRTRLSIHVLDTAMRLVAGAPARPAIAIAGKRLLGCALTERDIRLGLEREYRSLARLSPSSRLRISLVDKANSIRPVTWM